VAGKGDRKKGGKKKGRFSEDHRRCLHCSHRKKCEAQTREKACFWIRLVRDRSVSGTSSSPKKKPQGEEKKVATKKDWKGETKKEITGEIRLKRKKHAAGGKVLKTRWILTPEGGDQEGFNEKLMREELLLTG